MSFSATEKQQMTLFFIDEQMHQAALAPESAGTKSPKQSLTIIVLAVKFYD